MNKAAQKILDKLKTKLRRQPKIRLVAKDSKQRDIEIQLLKSCSLGKRFLVTRYSPVKSYSRVIRFIEIEGQWYPAYVQYHNGYYQQVIYPKGRRVRINHRAQHDLVKQVNQWVTEIARDHFPKPMKKHAKKPTALLSTQRTKDLRRKSRS